MEPRNLFHLLPQEIAGEICDYLPFADIISLLLCNRATNIGVTQKINYYWYTRLRNLKSYQHVENGTRQLLSFERDCTLLVKWFTEKGSLCPINHCNGECKYETEDLLDHCTFSPLRKWMITLARHGRIYTSKSIENWRRFIIPSLQIHCNNPEHQVSSAPRPYADFTYYTTRDYFRYYRFLLFQNQRIGSHEFIGLSKKVDEEGLIELNRLMDEQANIAIQYIDDHSNVGVLYIKDYTSSFSEGGKVK